MIDLFFLTYSLIIRLMWFRATAFLIFFLGTLIKMENPGDASRTMLERNKNKCLFFALKQCFNGFFTG